MIAWTLALVTTVSAGAAELRPAQTAALQRARSAESEPHGSIAGAAWNADNTGLSGARLRLRHIGTGKITGAATADESGRFRFDNVAEGTYVIELVDESGKVLAVGHVFTIAKGQTVATFVRLGTRVPWFSGFFSNAAATAISSAASQGITALAPVARPVSRKQ